MKVAIAILTKKTIDKSLIWLTVSILQFLFSIKPQIL